MRKLLHIGIPTKTKPADATFVDMLKVSITDPAKSAHQIEWLYFESNSPMAKLIQEQTHFAYQVENLVDALKDKEIIWPYTDMDGMKIAFIVEEGIPVELVELS